MLADAVHEVVNGVPGSGRLAFNRNGLGQGQPARTFLHQLFKMILMPFEFQMIVHPRTNQFRVDGLGDIINCTQAQTFGLILIIGQRRDENYGYIGRIAVCL